MNLGLSGKYIRTAPGNLITDVTHGKENQNVSPPRTGGPGRAKSTTLAPALLLVVLIGLLLFRFRRKAA